MPFPSPLTDALCPYTSSPAPRGPFSNHQPRAWESFSNCTEVLTSSAVALPGEAGVVFLLRKQDKQGETSCSESHGRQRRKTSSAVSDLITHGPRTAVCTGPQRLPGRAQCRQLRSTCLLSQPCCDTASAGPPSPAESRDPVSPRPSPRRVYLTAPHSQDSPIHSINIRWRVLSSTAWQIQKWSSVFRLRMEPKRFTHVVEEEKLSV